MESNKIRKNLNTTKTGLSLGLLILIFLFQLFFTTVLFVIIFKYLTHQQEIFEFEIKNYLKNSTENNDYITINLTQPLVSDYDNKNLKKRQINSQNKVPILIEFK
jgi:hypothetical protein